MMTTREFAEAVGREKITVLRWLQKGLVPGAVAIQETSGRTYRIPTSAVALFKDRSPRPRGRPPKPAREGTSKAARKQPVN
jgi:hypothetical protein